MNGDDRSEVRVSDVEVNTRIGNRDLNIESSYEYGARVGYWRLLKAFNDRGLKATVNLVGLAGEQNPQALRAMIDSGFDLQPHGWAGSTSTALTKIPNASSFDAASSKFAN